MVSDTLDEEDEDKDGDGDKLLDEDNCGWWIIFILFSRLAVLRSDLA